MKNLFMLLTIGVLVYSATVEAWRGRCRNGHLNSSRSKPHYKPHQR